MSVVQDTFLFSSDEQTFLRHRKKHGGAHGNTCQTRSCGIFVAVGDHCGAFVLRMAQKKEEESRHVRGSVNCFVFLFFFFFLLQNAFQLMKLLD